MNGTMNDRLVRLSLGLPDAGMIRGGAAALQAAVRAMLRTDTYAAGEQMRLAEVVRARGMPREEVKETREQVQERGQNRGR